MYIYLITDSNGRLCDVDSIGKIMLIASPHSTGLGMNNVIYSLCVFPFVVKGHI